MSTLMADRRKAEAAVKERENRIQRLRAMAAKAEKEATTMSTKVTEVMKTRQAVQGEAAARKALLRRLAAGKRAHVQKTKEAKASQAKGVAPPGEWRPSSTTASWKEVVEDDKMKLGGQALKQRLAADKRSLEDETMARHRAGAEAIRAAREALRKKREETRAAAQREAEQRAARRAAAEKKRRADAEAADKALALEEEALLLKLVQANRQRTSAEQKLFDMMLQDGQQAVPKMIERRFTQSNIAPFISGTLKDIPTLQVVGEEAAGGDAPGSPDLRRSRVGTGCSGGSSDATGSLEARSLPGSPAPPASKSTRLVEAPSFQGANAGAGGGAAEQAAGGPVVGES